MCIHLHFVHLARNLKEDIGSETKGEAKIAQEPETSLSCIGRTWHTDLEGLPTHHAASLKLQMQQRIPYVVPPDVIQKVDEICVQPGVEKLAFEPSEQDCWLCGSKLNDAVYPQGCDSSRGNGMLLINKHPFFRIDIKVKKCSNVDCGAVNQLFPYSHGKIFQYICIPLMSVLASKQLPNVENYIFAPDNAPDKH